MRKSEERIQIPVQPIGYESSDGHFLRELYAVAYFKALEPRERQSVLDALRRQGYLGEF